MINPVCPRCSSPLETQASPCPTCSNSQMEERFRVLASDGKKDTIILYSTNSYQQAEKFCWEFKGVLTEIWIQKLWIKRS